MAPTDEELLELMPQGFRDDLALVSRMAAHGAGPEVQPGLFRVTLNTGALDYARAVWDRARAALAQLEPEVVGPSVEELDDLFNEIDQSGEPLSWRAYARAVLSRYGRPTPAPAGEAGELVAWLTEQAVLAADCKQPMEAGMLTWAAQVVGEHTDPVDRQAVPVDRQAVPVDRQAVPVPVAIADRLPTPSECDRGRCWWGRQVNSRRWSWTFSIDPQGDTHWLPATVERLPANIVPVLPEDAQVIEPTERTILVPVPAPVAVSERPWEREGWCHPQERWAWFYNRRVGWRDAIPPESLKPPTLFPYTHSLPFNALPLPSGEVQP